MFFRVKKSYIVEKSYINFTGGHSVWMSSSRTWINFSVGRRL